MNEERMMFLDHVQLAMPRGEEEQAVSFFVGVIGMTQIEKPEPLRSRGGCWFTSGPTHLHLGIESDFNPQQKAHPAFCIVGLNALAERLVVAGHEVIWDDTLTDRKRFYTSDPFGNRIEFMQSGDGFSQR